MIDTLIVCTNQGPGASRRCGVGSASRDLIDKLQALIVAANPDMPLGSFTSTSVVAQRGR